MVYTAILATAFVMCIALTSQTELVLITNEEMYVLSHSQITTLVSMSKSSFYIGQSGMHTTLYTSVDLMDINHRSSSIDSLTFLYYLPPSCFVDLDELRVVVSSYFFVIFDF
jgi:hypothetical protein